MKHEPCCRCRNLTDKHTPAYFDEVQKVQYALCLPCQKATKLGLYKVRVAPVGDEYADW